MTKHRMEFGPARREGKPRNPGTGAENAPEHFFRIAQWAALKGGSFTAAELHERFGIGESTCFRYLRAWRKVFGKPGLVVRRKKEAKGGEPAVPAKVSLADLLKAR
jgi:hypothetical protein